MSFAVAARLDAAGIPYLIATGYSAATLPSPLRDKPLIEKPYRPEQVAEMLAPDDTG